MTPPKINLQWQDDYCIGDAFVDAQHRQLFELLQRLNLALAECRGSVAVGAALGELVTYTRHHFADEERLMKRLRFPGLQAHQKQHKQLMAQVEEVQDEYEEGKPVLTIELIQFLKHWLVDHILEEDMKIRDFRRQQD